MVRVVGKDKKYVKEASCSKCSSILEYTESEVYSSKVTTTRAIVIFSTTSTAPLVVIRLPSNAPEVRSLRIE